MCRQTPANLRDAKRAARLSISAVAAGAVAIGMAPVLVKLSEVGPVTTAFWRLALSTPLLWCWYALSRRREAGSGQAAPSGRDWLYLLIPGLFFAADLSVWHWSLELTTVANATLLVNFAPVFVTIAAWIWLRERFGALFVVGMALALTGAAFLVRGSLKISQQNLLGDALGFGTALFYAGYILSVKWLRERFSVVTIMAWSSLSCSVALFAIARVSGEKLTGMSLNGWLVVLSLALVCHCGGQGLITFGLGRLPASFSSVTLLVQPVAAAAFAWVILGNQERLGPVQIACGVLVVAGIFVARRGSFDERPAPSS